MNLRMEGKLKMAGLETRRLPPVTKPTLESLFPNCLQWQKQNPSSVNPSWLGFFPVYEDKYKPETTINT
jgi:hypothetical protein